jgi:hypothetical protein
MEQLAKAFARFGPSQNNLSIWWLIGAMQSI